MTLDDRVRLTITADFGSGTVDGIFEFGPAEEGKFVVNEYVQFNYVAESMFDQLSGVLKEFLGSDEDIRKGISVDLGGGVHTVEIDFQNPGPDDTYQWGSSADPADGPNGQTATGAGPQQQQQTLLNYFRQDTFGSENPITVEFGEYASSGYLDPLKMTPKEPSAAYGNENPSKWDGSMTLLSVQDLSAIIDGSAQKEG